MHNVKSSVGIPILVTALACSLAFNLVQYAAKKAPLPPLSGTYRTAETTPGAGAYLVFDRNGNYCRYTQAQGVFEIGTYAEGGENQISLTASTGAYRRVLRTRDATYLFAGEDLSRGLFANCNIFFSDSFATCSEGHNKPKRDTLALRWAWVCFCLSSPSESARLPLGSTTVAPWAVVSKCALT